jgi:hypothetical protein
MVDAGILRRRDRHCGPTRFPVVDRDTHAALLAEVRAAATGTGQLSDRDAVLLALAGPCQMLRVVAPRRSDRSQANHRIMLATSRVPVAHEVRTVTGAVNSRLDWAALPL